MFSFPVIARYRFFSCQPSYNLSEVISSFLSSQPERARFASCVLSRALQESRSLFPALLMHLPAPEPWHYSMWHLAVGLHMWARSLWVQTRQMKKPICSANGTGLYWGSQVLLKPLGKEGRRRRKHIYMKFVLSIHFPAQLGSVAHACNPSY